MRQNGVHYLVGTPKGRLTKLEQEFLEKPWQAVREGVSVKLLEQNSELLVLAKSADRIQKDRAIRRRKLKRLYAGLHELQRQAPTRDEFLQKLGALKHEAGRAARLVTMRLPAEGEAVNAQTFAYELNRKKFRRAWKQHGRYILRTNLTGEDPAVLWQRYIQLTEIEAAFKCLKSDLAVRPFHHQLERRMEAHLFVAVLAYTLTATLRQRLRVHAPGLTPKAVLEKLASIQMLDVWLPTSDGRWLVLPRYTQPEPEHQLVLKPLKLELPPQPPPRIYASPIQNPVRGR
jgi:hypothetical protein